MSFQWSRWCASSGRLIFGFVAVAVVGNACLSQHAYATTVTLGGVVEQNSVPGGGIGDSGYVFFSPKLPANAGSPGPDVVSLPSFISGITDDPNALRFNAPSGVYSTITVNGTLYASGLAYRTTSGNLTTLTLQNSGLPSSFQLAILGNNYNYNGPTNPTVSYTVSAPGSSDTHTVINTGMGDFQRNFFYLFNITNLTPGDSITISGVTGADGMLVGGLAFTAVPEPSSFALFGLGMIGLLVRRRR